jgi:short-subunit dehydrogenase
MAGGTALITGASSGIGAEFARLCAADGYDLILVARREELLDDLARELETRHKIAVQVIAADLADPSAPDAIYQGVGDQRVDILVNNAGFGAHGPFAASEWRVDRNLFEVNMASLVHLTRLFLPGMAQRGFGRVLNVASTAAFVPGPFMAMYYASKAFVLSFSHAVASELQGSGVTLTVLCPGPTRTGFESAAGLSHSRLFRGRAMQAADVARQGYTAMMQGKVEIIAGARNRWLILGTRLAPRTLLAGLARRLNSSVQ